MPISQGILIKKVSILISENAIIIYFILIKKNPFFLDAFGFIEYFQHVNMTIIRINNVISVSHGTKNKIRFLQIFNLYSIILLEVCK